jgi:hypothetical protein
VEGENNIDEGLGSTEYRGKVGRKKEQGQIFLMDNWKLNKPHLPLPPLVV